MPRGDDGVLDVAGNLALLPLVLAGGILMLRKLRRLDLAAALP